MTRLLALTLLVGCATPTPADDDGFDWDTDGRPDAPEQPVPAVTAVPDRDWLPEALGMLSRAEDHLALSAFLIVPGGSVDAFLDAVASTVDRGVTCQVLADEESDATLDALAWLDERGCTTRLDAPTTTTHTKLLLVDDEALLGSHNLTHAALRHNVEASVRLADPEAVAQVRRAFDDLWQDSATPPPLDAPVTGEVQVVAHDEVLDALRSCIDDAETRVDVQLYAIAWDDRYPGSEVDQLLGALEQAHARGVAVRVAVDGSPWSVDNRIDDAAIARLDAADIAVRRNPSHTVHHAKVLACDDRVVVGDANWSYSGLALYNGVSVVLTDPEQVATWRTWLDARWAASAEP